MNNINDTYFARRFEQNINDITDIRKCGYWQMPFIPYTFSLYQSAPIKAFFIGRDTYYWCEYDESYANNPRAYMKENSEYVTVNRFKKIGLYRVVFGVWLENCSYSCTLENTITLLKS